MPICRSSTEVGKAAGFDGIAISNGGKVLSFDYLDPSRSRLGSTRQQPMAPFCPSVEDCIEGPGYGLYLATASSAIHFTMRWTDFGMRLETAATARVKPVARTCCSPMTAHASLRRPDLCGWRSRRRLKVLFDEMSWPLGDPQPLRIGAGEGLEDRFQGAIGTCGYTIARFLPRKPACCQSRRAFPK